MSGDDIGSDPSFDLTFGIAIPAYNNVDKLSKCLLAIQRFSPALHDRIVVADDSGNAQIHNSLADEFPAVKWIVHERNLGFGRSANEAVSACDADIVILLNDDVQLLCDPLPALKKVFVNPRIFAATFRSVNAIGEFREGAKRLRWQFGIPRILHNQRDQLNDKVGDYLRSSYAVGGHAAFRKSAFAKLRGFDPLFDPFYWEDVDLSQRARSQNWEIVYATECLVQHDERGAIRSTFDQRQIRLITLRNRLLFAWRHMPRFGWPFHLFSLLYLSVTSWIGLDLTFYRALRAALRKRKAT